jgi:HTH-type transcriptional regulator / antitoxin HigA
VSFDPDWVIAPGETLEEWRIENGLGPKAAATVCRMSPEDFARIVSGKKRITADVAGRLQAGTMIPARLWLRLEENYREGLRRGKIDASR